MFYELNKYTLFYKKPFYKKLTTTKLLFHKLPFHKRAQISQKIILKLMTSVGMIILDEEIDIKLTGEENATNENNKNVIEIE